MSEVMENRKEAAVTSFAEMLGRGERVTIDEYVQCFPEAERNELRESLEAVVIMQGWAGELPEEAVDRMLLPQAGEEEEQAIRRVPPRWSDFFKKPEGPLVTDSSLVYSMWRYNDDEDEE